MKKKIIIIITLLLPLFSFSQEKQQKIREIGLNFYNFDNFGVRFKTGTNKTVLRLTFLTLTAGKTDINIDTLKSVTSVGFSFNIGLEKKKQLNDKMNFLYGFEIRNSVDLIWRLSGSDHYSGFYGLGLILGVQYNINEALNFSVELSPALYYNYNISKEKGKTYRNNFVNFGLGNTGANITLAYRFVK